MKALVARLDSFGDVLLAGPAIRAVAARADHTTLLCSPRGAPAARMLPGVDDVLEWEAPWVGFDPPPVDRDGIGRLVDRIARAAPDTALVLTSFHQSPLPTALLLRMAGVRRIAADSTDYPGSLLDVRHRRGPHRHEVRAALDLAEAAGFPLPEDDDGRLAVTPPPGPPASPSTTAWWCTREPRSPPASGAASAAPRPYGRSSGPDTASSSPAAPTSGR
ncbi:hypothetical protein GCM10020000_01850 [Streptomyces olivoverticillatus]